MTQKEMCTILEMMDPENLAALAAVATWRHLEGVYIPLRSPENSDLAKHIQRLCAVAYNMEIPAHDLQEMHERLYGFRNVDIVSTIKTTAWYAGEALYYAKCMVTEPPTSTETLSERQEALYEALETLLQYAREIVRIAREEGIW